MHKTYIHTHSRWFAKDMDEVFNTLESDPVTGLTQQAANFRLERFGTNALPSPKRKSLFRRFFFHFHNILIYILFVSAFITLILRHYADTVVILTVTVINASIGFFQESKARQALDRISSMLSSQATVLRDGKNQKIPASELALGDIVLLSPGAVVPADLRLFQAHGLTIEEAALTGESVPSYKHTAILDAETPLGDRSNMAYSGTAVRAGTGTGIVIAVGIETEIGRVSQLISKVEPPTTPLIKQMDALAKRIAISIAGISLAAYAFGHFFRAYSLMELLLFAIGLAVAAIPEGLPAISSIILAKGVQTMARHKVIVRNLPSVETLGSVSVICADKTGTLTKNEMTTKSLITRESIYTVSGSGYNPSGKILKDGKQAELTTNPGLVQLLRTFRICNNAVFGKDAHGAWSISGDPVEGALAVAYAKSGLTGDLPQRQCDFPFDFSCNYMATLTHSSDRNIIHLKGDATALLALATHEYGARGPQPINRKYWESGMLSLSAQGQRVLGAAWRYVDKSATTISHASLREDVCFLGLAGMLDPPYDEVPGAIKDCHTAGIAVKMITGDHADTAKYIAKQLGIGDGKAVVSGNQLDNMTPEQFKDAATRCDVFARTSPEHKLRLVEALQANGAVCAMIGDGVNDAPALQQADIGVSMGTKGTEPTKEVAEIVLAGDNFSAIITAVEEGRRVYDNLKKTILFILPINRAESFLIMTSILLGTPLPLTPAQILWLNMVTSVTISLALAFEKAEPDIMKRTPRPTEEYMMSGYFIWRIFFVSALIGGLILTVNYFLFDPTSNADLVRTTTLQAIVMCQAFHLFNSRTLRSSAFQHDFFSNKAALIACLLVFIFQIAVTNLPVMNHIFSTVPLPASHWFIAFMIGFAVFLMVEGEKTVMRKLDERCQEADKYLP